MKDILIAVDSGKHTTKGLTSKDLKTEKIMFRTKMQLVDDLGIDITPNTYMVNFNGIFHMPIAKNKFNINADSAAICDGIL